MSDAAFSERRFPSPLGEITAAAAGGALVGLWFADQAHFGETPGLKPGSGPADPGDEAVLEAARVWLERCFRGEDPGEPPPLRLAGTPFQRAVWALLREIPRGETRSYAQLAKRLGSSPRAVGGAVARNPISLMVPCHRVLGADGSLTGYAGGQDRKAALLALERRPGTQEAAP